MTEPPLTLRQLQAWMRLAGWKRLPGPGSAYQHQVTGKVINLLDVIDIIKLDGVSRMTDVQASGIWRVTYEWQRWAAARETPPPF